MLPVISGAEDCGIMLRVPQPTHLDPDRYPFVARESELAAAAQEELGEALALAHEAVGNLADALWHTRLPPTDDPNEASFVRRASIQGLAGLAVRTGRALILLIRHGWEPEAHALKRRLTECSLRAEAVIDDESGEAARHWLDGRGRKAPALAARYEVEKPWRVLSAGAHADARSLRLSMVPPPWIDVPNEQRALELVPRRDRDHAEGLLLETTWECGMLLVALAVSQGGSVAFANEHLERVRRVLIATRSARL